MTYKWLPEEQLAHVTVEQTQQTGDAVLLFDLSSKLRFIVDGEAIDEPITINGKKHDFYVRLPGEPTIALFDPEFTLLAKTTFDKPDKMLTAQLQYEPNVIARVQACEGLAERHTHAAVDALKQALQNDPFYGVRSAAATALRKIRTEEAVAALIASFSSAERLPCWRASSTACSARAVGTMRFLSRTSSGSLNSSRKRRRPLLIAGCDRLS